MSYPTVGVELNRTSGEKATSVRKRGQPNLKGSSICNRISVAGGELFFARSKGAERAAGASLAPWARISPYMPGRGLFAAIPRLRILSALCPRCAPEEIVKSCPDKARPLTI